MRLDASLGHKARVWDCRTQSIVLKCIWVDDQTHQYGVWTGAFMRGSLVLDVVQARLIVICAGGRLVLIDPDEPLEQQEVAEATEELTST